MCDSAYSHFMSRLGLLEPIWRSKTEMINRVRGRMSRAHEGPQKGGFPHSRPQAQHPLSNMAMPVLIRDTRPHRAISSLMRTGGACLSGIRVLTRYIGAP